MVSDSERVGSAVNSLAGIGQERWVFMKPAAKNLREDVKQSREDQQAFTSCLHVQFSPHRC